MRIRLIAVCAALLIVSCQTSPPVTPVTLAVNTTLVPGNPALPPVDGNPQPVAALRDSAGLRGELVEAYLLIRPRSPTELQRFLAEYGGVVVRDDTVAQPPARLGIELTAQQRAPRQYLVRIDLTRVSTANTAMLAARSGWQGSMEFSSDAGLRTFAAALDARARGYRADGNFVYEFNQGLPATPQSLPLTLLTTTERAGFDPYQQTQYGAAPNGSMTDLVRAWQFVAAHGIQRQPWVAIIDGGFNLTPTGAAAPGDADLLGIPVQRDIAQNDFIADGGNLMTCTGGAACPWHGTQAASVAAGVMNNSSGVAGSGSVVGNLMLFKVSPSRANLESAVREASSWGADVISMSLGYICDSVACRERDRDENPFPDAFGGPNRPVFIASAGNGEGGVGFNVGHPKYYHPCIENHVICVGALNTSAADPNNTSRIGYSNFGERVSVFAPTNLPVVTTPGAAPGSTFGGTSASAPYVAGIAAMIKAINPSLNGDQVGDILRETARPGTGDATRIVDALAAVRRAAQPIVMVPDRYENNNAASAARDLGVKAVYTENNLNLDAADRDYFRITSPGASTATVELRYASALGTATLGSFTSDSGNCSAAQILGDVPTAGGNGRRVSFRVPGGPHVLAVQADTTLAYNLGVTFSGVAIPPDIYEANETSATARWLRGWGFSDFLGGTVATLSSAFTINAAISAPGDVDWYLVRGVPGKKKFDIGGILIFYHNPAVSLFGNESRIELQVFDVKPDDSQGALWGRLVSNSCAPDSLAVNVESDRYYLVRVSGEVGRYKLSNGINITSRRLPFLQHDRVFERFHPGDPIEFTPDVPRYFDIDSVAGYEALVAGQGVRMVVRDAKGRQVRESAAFEQGQRLNIAGLGAGHTLEIAPREVSPDGSAMSIRWVAATPVRASGNLLQNPGAEEAAGNTLPGWTDEREGGARSLTYSSLRDLRNAVSELRDLGERLFVADAQGRPATLTQTVAIPSEWLEAVRGGRVKVGFAGLLGGRGRQDVRVHVVSLGAQRETVAEIAAAAVGRSEREARTGLVAVGASESLPPSSRFISVTLDFVGTGDQGGGFADRLQLQLAEYANSGH